MANFRITAWTFIAVNVCMYAFFIVCLLTEGTKVDYFRESFEGGTGT